MLDVETLVATALEGDEDDEAAWDAIRSLRVRGDEVVFLAATKLLKSSSEKERGRGADVLAQLGTPEPSLELRTRCADAILEVLATENAPRVLNSIGVALGHLRDPRAVVAMRRHRNHADAEVRLGVVMALLPHEAAEPLIELSGDVDDDVRNWATFGLATMSFDDALLRDALVERLGDVDAEIRGEALVGLARRHDPRVVAPLREALSARPVGVLAVEAAGVLGDASMLPLLFALRSSGTTTEFFDAVLDEAIALLSNAN